MVLTKVCFNENGKNPGDVWSIQTKPSTHKHYASYNSNLIDKCIVSGCPKDGIVLDPFCGTGTTLKRARELGRYAVGFDGKKEYCETAEKYLESVPELLF